jgi:hypothetical protein
MVKFRTIIFKGKYMAVDFLDLPGSRSNIDIKWCNKEKSHQRMAFL